MIKCRICTKHYNFKCTVQVFDWFVYHLYYCALLISIDYGFRLRIQYESLLKEEQEQNDFIEQFILQK